MTWHRLVGARQDPAQRRVLTPGHPRLLAADHERVTVLHRAGAQAREIRPGFWLGEPLTPDLLGGQDRRDVAPALVVVAEAEQRGTENAESDDVHELRRTGGCQFLVDDDLLDGWAASATEFRGPCPSDEPGFIAGGLPAFEHRHPLVELMRQLLETEILAREERADLVRKCALRGGLSELHRTEIVSGTCVIGTT